MGNAFSHMAYGAIITNKSPKEFCDRLETQTDYFCLQRVGNDSYWLSHVEKQATKNLLNPNAAAVLPGFIDLNTFLKTKAESAALFSNAKEYYDSVTSKEIELALYLKLANFAKFAKLALCCPISHP